MTKSRSDAPGPKAVMPTIERPLASTWPARLMALAVTGVLHSMPASAAEPADRAIAAAVYDLDRIAPQLPGLTPSRRANITRIERSLSMAEQRLMQSPNQQHESFLAAQKRIAEYRAHLASLTNPAPAAAPASASTSPAPARASTSPAPATSRTATSSGVTQAARQVAPAAAAAPEMSSHHKLQLSKLQRSFASVQANLDKVDPKSLHFEQERRNWRQRFDGLSNNLVKFEPFADDPQVAPLIEQLPKMVAHYDKLEADAIATYEALGDIPAQLQALKARYTREQLPKPLDPPYDAERAKAWAEYIRAFAGIAQKDHEWLTHVRATTDMHERATKDALNGWIGHTANNAIRQSIEQTRNDIYQPVRQLQGSSLEFLSKLTPADKDKIRNNLLGEGDYDKHMASLREARQAIENGRVIDAALGQPESADGAKVLAMLDDWQAKINGLYETMLAEIRMPKAASTSEELLDIAAKVLSGEKYGYKWENMVVNSDKQTRQEERAWYSGGVVTIAKYDWDSFQVATAEKVGDKYFLYYNTLRYYRSGASTTPINRWILASRHQSSRILPENIGKP
ncbi:MAG: hypothetical protein R3E83_01800 [Burkholderiaceae bacterium]